MSMDFRCLLAMFLVATPWAVVLSVCIGVGGCLCPISLRECRSGMASLHLMKISPSSASAADDITDLMIWEMVITAPLLSGMGELLDMKKWPPARLLAFDSER